MSSHLFLKRKPYGVRGDVRGSTGGMGSGFGGGTGAGGKGMGFRGEPVTGG